jgi:hypothetical protein
MGIFIPMDNYMVILEEVGRWKIIGMKKLYNSLNLESSYSIFCRQVRKLEVEGLLRSIVGMRKRKYLTLTKSGSKLAPYNAQFEESDAELNHDLIVSNVVMELNKFETLGDGHVVHDFHFLEVEADGLIYINKDGLKASMAIEVELTQKSKDRISRKLVAYNRASCINYCFYVFNKRSVFEAYKRELENKIESVRAKILLFLDENLSIGQFNYRGKLCYFKGNEKTFEHIFSNKEEG